MKVAVQIICYNEETFLGAVLKNWLGKVHTVTVFHTDKPWHGQELPHDRSENICKEMNTEFIRLPWQSETEQRNWALGHHSRFDYVLVVDADELYTEADQFKILETIGKELDEPKDNFWCYRAQNVKTYFKTPEFAFDVADTHKPVVAIDPKRTLFRENRVPVSMYQIPLDVTMHHLSYLRNDLRMYHKMRQFEHFDRVKPGWFEDVWKKWEPGSEAVVRAYGHEKSRAVRDPMPEELIHLLDFNEKLLSRM